MTLSTQALELVSGSDYFFHFKPGNLQGVLLWIVDRDLHIVDLTERTADYFGRSRDQMIGRHIGEFVEAEALLKTADEHRRIGRLKQPETITLWGKYAIGWRKVIITRAPLDDHYTIGVAQDITEQGLLNDWLLNLDLVDGKLPLGERYRSETLSWGELIVLHRMSRSRPYRDIATELHISPATVRYRLNRIKEKLGADTIDEMWAEVFSSGLVHILSLRMEPGRKFLDRRELLKVDPTTSEEPRQLR